MAPSSQIRPWSETLLNLPPARPSASNTVTFKPCDFNLYAAASPLHHSAQRKILEINENNIIHKMKKKKKENYLTPAPITATLLTEPENYC